MRFCEEQHLRALYSDNASLNAIQLLRPAFEKAYGTGNRGTLFGDMLAVGVSTEDGTIMPSWKLLESTELTETTAVLLSSWLKHHSGPSLQNKSARAFKTKQVNAIQSRDNIYKVADISERDSLVIFTKEGSSSWFAGQVEEIFLYGHQNGASIDLAERFLVLAEFQDLPTQYQSLDPYRQFPIVGGRLYHAVRKKKRILLPFHNISCPFAMTPHTLQTDLGAFSCVHVLPLDKVSLSAKGFIQIDDFLQD